MYIETVDYVHTHFVEVFAYFIWWFDSQRVAWQEEYNDEVYSSLAS